MLTARCSPRALDSEYDALDGRETEPVQAPTERARPGQLECLARQQMRAPRLPSNIPIYGELFSL